MFLSSTDGMSPVRSVSRIFTQTTNVFIQFLGRYSAIIHPDKKIPFPRSPLCINILRCKVQLKQRFLLPTLGRCSVKDVYAYTYRTKAGTALMDEKAMVTIICFPTFLADDTQY